MEKEMLVLLKLKEGKLETFMGWMQSDEGMGVRKSVAYPEKTVGAMIPDKSGMLFKVNVHNEAGMKARSSRGSTWSAPARSPTTRRGCSARTGS